MQFTKKIIVMKQIEDSCSRSNKMSGILRLERTNGITDVILSLINFPSNNGGEYLLMLFDGEKIFAFSLPDRPTSFSLSTERLVEFSKGVCAGIILKKNHIPSLLTFGSTENFPFTLCQFKQKVAEKCIEDKKNQKKDFIIEQLPQGKDDNNVSSLYDDEAVATENYFDLDDEICKKLNLIRSSDNEPFLKDELPFSERPNKTQESTSDDNLSENETNFDNGKKYSKDNPYYNTVSKELTEIFVKFPKEDGLERLFPKSKWSKIFYSNEKYYVVGLISEQQTEKYICYGVPAVYSPTPPKELEGFCSFIPLSVFDLNGEGYWMMFQDAVTGKCIKPN